LPTKSPIQSNERLYQQYRPKLLNICKEYAGEDDVAEDLLHDAFVIILTSLDKLEDPEKIESWMTAIVRNVGYHYRQHLNKEQSALQRFAQERPETAETNQAPDYDELQSLVSQLPQGYQQVFRLSVFEGLSHQEISQLLGIAPHSSSSQLAHAKRMLRALIRQSWVLFLLLIAIPTAVWKLLQKEEPTEQPATARKTSSEPQQPKPVVERPNDKPVYAAAGKRPSSSLVNYQTEAVVQPDSIPYQMIEEETDTLTETAQEEESPRDTLIYQPLPPLPSNEEYHLTVTTKSEPSDKWDLKLAYNGQIGQRDDYLAATTVGKGSFDAATNSPIPVEQVFDNWIGYNYFLNNSPYVSDDPETRSLINIATQNSAINGGKMEAQHEHQLPVTIQLLLSHPLSQRLSIETGLSYTRLSSTINTGSSQAYIQERQRIHYLGVPLRLGWQWYSKAHLSLYSSAGLMLELPIRSITDVNHVSNGTTTYHNESTLNAPNQLSTTLGIGLQYDFTPHLGIYLEPSLQYFFDDSNDIKTYRTEHPLSVTLPLGIRFRW
jgi:RNA polymerase sigma-70 factor (ECF subfamily)